MAPDEQREREAMEGIEGVVADVADESAGATPPTGAWPFRFTGAPLAVALAC